MVEAAGTEEVEYFFKRGIAKWGVCLAMSLAEKIKETFCKKVQHKKRSFVLSKASFFINFFLALKQMRMYL
ncbi:hypothetical protein PZ842_002891 [Listeria innocua]|nr:hypothetical protein [Listeria innocua]EKD8202392.1 hypothetical protein [Listeria innocua]EKO5599631.1 hypothetical protein [Listeria innocua]